MKNMKSMKGFSRSTLCVEMHKFFLHLVAGYSLLVGRSHAPAWECVVFFLDLTGFFAAGSGTHMKHV